MLAELLTIYDESRVNPGPPECLFAETLIFSEGWLLRAVLRQWKDHPSAAQFDFLPFPTSARLYSEGQLYTPFKRRRQSDNHAENNTHVDGIVGDFGLAGGSRSGIVVSPDCTYLAVFEAKMDSPLSTGVKNAPQYSQVARTAACMIHAMIEAECTEDFVPYLVVLYPAHNKDIKLAHYTRAHIEAQIAERIQGYLGPAGPTGADARFFREWRQGLNRLCIRFLTWEKVVAEIDNVDLDRFYGLCKRFNRGSPNKGRLE
jgi:hypothetical protein